MPPSPIVKATLNQASWRKLMNELGLSEDWDEPTLKMQYRDGPILGVCKFASPRCHIVLFYGASQEEASSLALATKEASRTILHEARHAWQFKNKGVEWMNADSEKPYDSKREEIDAEHFAHTRSHDYPMLVRLQRHYPSTPFSRLSATERAVRRVV